MKYLAGDECFSDCVVSLYSVAEGMTSGACSTRGQHVIVVSTNCAMCAGVEFNILVCVVVYE